MPQGRHPQERTERNAIASIIQKTGGHRTIAGLTGHCPTTTITVNGREAAALLDTGSEVTTLTETWAAARLRNLSLQQAYLKLRAVNGAEMPYAGILPVKHGQFWKKCPEVPVLVVKEPTELS